MDADMIEVPASRLGSADFYPEKRPVREVRVARFAIQRVAVTVAQFARLPGRPGT